MPIIQLSLSSDSLPDTTPNDLGQNIIRPALAVVHCAEVPYPYGGKPSLMASQRAVTLANERYQRGLTDFLNVMDAERAQYDIQQQYTNAQVALAQQFIELYRSLGGGWENYQQLPAIHRPEPAIIAGFQRVLSRSSALKDPTPP